MSEPTLRNNLQDTAPPDGVMEEFTLLMSLALDDLLDGGERARFEAMLDDYPALNDLWVEWQVVDQQLDTVPAVEPERGFVARFEARLAATEQRQQQRALAFSLVAILLIAVGALSVWISTGAFVLSTQGPWIGEQIRNATYFSVALSNWVSAAVDTLAGLATSPLAQTLGFVYTIVAILMISGWVLLLRHSTHLDGPTALAQME